MLFQICGVSYTKSETTKNKAREWNSQVNAWYGRVTTKRQRDAKCRRKKWRSIRDDSK